jgi:hypothetical protein
MVHRIVVYILLPLFLLFVSTSQNMASESTSEEVQLAASDSKKDVNEQTLYVGWASADIIPSKPVALVGQLTKRISQSVLDPLTAKVLAIETRADNLMVERRSLSWLQEIARRIANAVDDGLVLCKKRDSDQSDFQACSGTS